MLFTGVQADAALTQSFPSLENLMCVSGGDIRAAGVPGALADKVAALCATVKKEQEESMDLTARLLE